MSFNQKAYRLANPELIKSQRRARYILNRSKRIKATLDWQKNNPGKINAKNKLRKLSKKHRTPSWLSAEQLKEIQEFYILAKELQWLSIEPLEVDHIVPLNGKYVSGLHVPWNLQILPKSMNVQKGNK